MSALFLLQNYKPSPPPPCLIINSTSVFSRQTLKERNGIVTHKGQFNLRIHVCECLKNAQMKQQETRANYQAGDKKTKGRKLRHSRAQGSHQGAEGLTRESGPRSPQAPQAHGCLAGPGPPATHQRGRFS